MVELLAHLGSLVQERLPQPGPPVPQSGGRAGHADLCLGTSPTQAAQHTDPQALGQRRMDCGVQGAR